MDKLRQIIDESFDIGMSQLRREITPVAKFIRDNNINSFIEIGSRTGGSFNVWASICGDGKKVLIDLPEGIHGGQKLSVTEQRNEMLQSKFDNVHLAIGDSHTEETWKKVSSILDGDKVDFLFIDGDHTYAGVKDDYYMYKEFVKPGGFIGFHDIKETDYHKSVNCNVHKLWQTLKTQPFPFIGEWFSASNTRWMGIGLIQLQY